MIGTALIEKAVAEGVEVYCIVRPDTKRMDRLVQSDLVHPITGSMDSLRTIDGIPSDCDVLYHFAWAGTGRQDRNDARLQESNICYTLDAVELASKYEERTVFAGEFNQSGEDKARQSPV